MNEDLTNCTLHGMETCWRLDFHFIRCLSKCRISWLYYLHLIKTQNNDERNTDLIDSQWKAGLGTQRSSAKQVLIHIKSHELFIFFSFSFISCVVICFRVICFVLYVCMYASDFFFIQLIFLLAIRKCFFALEFNLLPALFSIRHEYRL